MRICLINPPRVIRKEWVNDIIRIPLEPLGLAYVAAVLEKNNFDVSILDAFVMGHDQWNYIDNSKVHVGLSYDEIASYIKNVSPDLVGISVPFSTQIQQALNTARFVKTVNPDIITVLGGPHPTITPRDVLSDENVDFVVIGEGEVTMLELALKLEKGQHDLLEEVKGLAFKKNEEPIITKIRPFIDYLDSLPFPARHLLPMDKYLSCAPVRRSRVITSRGCPYHCIFCSVHLHMGRRWRTRSPENIVEEIESLVKTYKIKEILFEDDNLTLNRKRMERICRLIIERGLDIDWYTRNGVRADTLDESLLKLMKKSGCKRLWFAPESGDQHVLDTIIKKSLDLKKVENATALSKKLGIKVSCFFVMGFPGETKGNINTTIKFAQKLKKLGADQFSFFIATPYIGTQLYEEAKTRGYLTKEYNYEKLTPNEVFIETPEFTAAELKQLQQIAMSRLNSRLTPIKQGLYAFKNNPLLTLKMLRKKARFHFETLFSEKLIHDKP